MSDKVVFTNGCFDVLHPGHIALLSKAAGLGSKLIVGINSDRSVRAIKGPARPLQSEEARKAVLLGLAAVDEVRIFDELTPERRIREIAPDVLVKGGDWEPSEVIGSDTVKAAGGDVVIIPLVDGFSTTGIVEKITLDGEVTRPPEQSNDVLRTSIIEHQDVFASLDNVFLSSVRESSEIIIDTFRKGGKLLLCGNGGSAADAQHLAAEFVGRYETERRSLPAIAITTDTSALTAIANDYTYDRVFARQIEGLAASDDCLIAISTSGNSPNILAAVMTARSRGCRVIGVTGAGGKKLASLSDSCVSVPSKRTARVQEVHLTVYHIWCELVDAAFNQ